MKKALIALALAALAGLGWQIRVRIGEAKDATGGGPGGPGKRGNAVTVAVELSPVTNTTLRLIGRFTGSLHPLSRFVVAPKVAGRLQKLTVNIGDPVRDRQLIAELDDDEHVQQVAQARAELAVASAAVLETRSALDVASRDLLRVTTLHEKRVASDADRDEAQARHVAADAKHQVALSEVVRREAALKGAEVRMSYTRIRVAWDDTNAVRVVGERFVDEGEMLNPNQPIVSILDNRVMIAAVDVIERDYPGIRVGQEARLTTDGFPGRDFLGRVARIAPLLKEGSRQARVEMEVPNPEDILKPGMFVRAAIEFDRRDNATVVPVAALARRDGKQGVFVADIVEKKALFVPVTTGILDGPLVEIRDPPLSGFVVSLGHHLLEDGAGIRLPETDADRRPASKQDAPGPRKGDAR